MSPKCCVDENLTNSSEVLDNLTLLLQLYNETINDIASIKTMKLSSEALVIDELDKRKDELKEQMHNYIDVL